MNQREIQRMIRKAFGNPNMMTPEVVRYGHRGDRIWEVSKGESILDRDIPIIGISVVGTDGKYRSDESKLFHDDWEGAREFEARIGTPRREIST